MPSNVSPQQLRKLGSQIAQFVQTQAVAARSPGTMQGVIADLTASYPDLAAPLRDLTGRQAFHALIPFALSGRGSIQRDALIQEISRIYHPEMVVMLEDVINGFLETTDGISRSLLDKPSGTTPTEPISESFRTSEPRPTPTQTDHGGHRSPPSLASGPSAPAEPVSEPFRSIEPPTTATLNRSRRSQLGAVVGLLAIGSAGTLGITSLISRLSKPEKSCAQIASEAVPLPAESKEFQHLIEANKGRCSAEPDFLIQQAIAANYKGNHQEALLLIHKSIALNPGNGGAYYWEGQFYFDSKNYRMALASFEKSLQISPKDESSHFMKGVTLTWLDDPAGAIAAFTKAIAIKQDPQYYRERAGSRLQTKDYSLALADANKAIQMNSKDGDAYRLRAYIKTWLDDFTGACSDIKEARGLGIKRVPNGSGTDMPIDQSVKEICS
jgi:Flp pilus assembly protein TadD